MISVGWPTYLALYLLQNKHSQPKSYTVRPKGTRPRYETWLIHIEVLVDTRDNSEEITGAFELPDGVSVLGCEIFEFV